MRFSDFSEIASPPKPDGPPPPPPPNPPNDNGGSGNNPGSPGENEVPQGSQSDLRNLNGDTNKMPILRVTAFATFGGRDANDYFTNEFMLRADAPLSDPTYEECADAVATALGTIMVDRARITRIVFSPMPEKGQRKAKRGDHMPFGVDVVGQREVPAGSDPAILSMTATFAKNGGPGFAGRMKVRGCYIKTEITSGSDLHPATIPAFDRAPFDAFAANLPGIFEATGGEMVLSPEPGLKGEADYRAVRSLKYQGPSQKQRRNTRATLKAAQRALVKRELKDAAKQYTDAQKDALSGGFALPQSVVDFVVDVIVELIRKYGYTVLLRAGIPAPIRVLTATALALTNKPPQLPGI